MKELRIIIKRELKVPASWSWSMCINPYNFVVSSIKDYQRLNQCARIINKQCSVIMK